VNQRRLKHHAAGDVLNKIGQMLTNKGIVIAELIGQDDDVSVLAQSFCGAARSRMHGHCEVTKTHGEPILWRLFTQRA
jgi:hypothetical protein